MEQWARKNPRIHGLRRPRFENRKAWGSRCCFAVNQKPISKTARVGQPPSFSLLLGEMLCRLKTLGCTKIVQTKCGAVETIENIAPKFGGASRDRTDDLIVANDGVRQLISLTRLHLAAEFGPLRSNSTIHRPAGVLPQELSVKRFKAKVVHGQSPEEARGRLAQLLGSYTRRQ